jgi:hypothetical protein
MAADAGQIANAVTAPPIKIVPIRIILHLCLSVEASFLALAENARALIRDDKPHGYSSWAPIIHPVDFDPKS